MRTPSATRRAARVAACGALALVLAACAPQPEAPESDSVAAPSPDTTTEASPAPPEESPTPEEPAEEGFEVYTVADPGPLQERLLPADLLVSSDETIDPATRRRIEEVDGIDVTLPMALAQVSVDGRTINMAAADPGRYRRFTPSNAAQLEEIWQRVAGGEIAVEPALGKRLQQPDGSMRLGNDEESPALHIGAFASMVPRVHAVVNQAWGEALGMPAGNAMLISTGQKAPQPVADEIRDLVGSSASVQILGPDLDINVQQTAFLTGGSVGAAVGSFTYTPRANGTVVVDPAWVSANIRTESVPILGNVTCHKVMLPQMRAALQEIVDRGLANKINPGEYAGCYYPRFIASDPAQGLSLHSWGIAFDVNTPGNQRGTVGEIDRTVVSIFKKWGFAWGGDWSYTDPMHFELSALVESR